MLTGNITLLDIIRHTPPWVWGVLAALTALGLRRLRPQKMPRWRVLLAPVLLLLLGLVAGLRNPAALLGWGVALLTGAALAGVLLPPRRGVRYDAARGLLHIPGSMAPLFFMLSLFLLNYLLAVSLAIHLLRADDALALLLSAVGGLLSGVFLGRSLKLLSVAKANLAEAA